MYVSCCHCANLTNNPEGFCSDECEEEFQKTMSHNGSLSRAGNGKSGDASEYEIHLDISNWDD